MIEKCLSTDNLNEDFDPGYYTYLNINESDFDQPYYTFYRKMAMDRNITNPFRGNLKVYL